MIIALPLTQTPTLNLIPSAGSRMWTEVAELGELIRSGKATWEDLDLDDIDTRLKWAGLFHRRKRVPGTFMMRLKVSVRDAERKVIGTCRGVAALHAPSSRCIAMLTLRGPCSKATAVALAGNGPAFSKPDLWSRRCRTAS